MSNARKLPGERLGLVEVEIDADSQVALTIHPPGKQSATILMPPDQARDLAKGLLEGADQAEGGPLEAIGAGPLLDPDCRDGKHQSCVGAPCECGCHGR